MTNTITLNESYSTTRLIFNDECLMVNEKEDNSKFKIQNSTFVLPEDENRRGEGGLRTQGYFKSSYEDLVMNDECLILNDKDGNKYTVDNPKFKFQNPKLEKLPLISIITVVYNGQKYLEETILSVLNQTYDNVEYIIIDGGSTDGTLDIIKKYEDKIDYWVSEKDKGIYDAMNKGIALASGQWINFMNAGDEFFDMGVLTEISRHLHADLVYGNHAVYDDDKNSNTVIDVSSYKDTRNIPFCHQSLFALSKLLKENPFDMSYKIAADYDQYLKLKNLNATILYIPITISLYLDGGLSAISRKKLIEEYYDVTKKYTKISSFFVYMIRLLQYKLLGK